jgi:hypothetical protein
MRACTIVAQVWVYRQIQECVAPLHPGMMTLVDALINCQRQLLQQALVSNEPAMIPEQLVTVGDHSAL